MTTHPQEAQNVFLFVVRHARWLAKVPFLPQLFDSMLLLWVCVVKRTRLEAMEALEAAALRLPGVTLRIHRFGGTEFYNGDNRRELGHIHGHGLLDVRLDRAAAQTLLANGRVHPHHFLPDSGWISFQLETLADVPFALELLQRHLPSQ